jgi:hypothetical protein
VINIAIWFMGFLINCVRGFPTFHPLPVLSGVLWTVSIICFLCMYSLSKYILYYHLFIKIGSFLSVYSIRLIGMGLATCTWNMICK